jgi:hypothetical protein
MALSVAEDIDARIMAVSLPGRAAGMAMPEMMALTRSTMVENIPLSALMLAVIPTATCFGIGQEEVQSSDMARAEGGW